jgi:hypothetical protein
MNNVRKIAIESSLVEFSEFSIVARTFKICSSFLYIFPDGCSFSKELRDLIYEFHFSKFEVFLKLWKYRILEVGVKQKRDEFYLSLFDF